MKYRIGLITLVFVFAFGAVASAQDTQSADDDGDVLPCNKQVIFDANVSKLGEYTYVTELLVDGTNDPEGQPSVRKAIYMSKNFKYKILGVGVAEDVVVIVEVYDKNNKLITSNAKISGPDLIPFVIFRPETTGPYYVKFTVKSGSAKCALGIIGSTKK